MNLIRNSFYFIAFFLILPWFSVVAQTDSTRLHFELKGTPAGTARLIGMVGEQRYVLDTIIVAADGSFDLNRKTPMPAGYYYWLFQGGKSMAFLVDGHTDQQFTFKGDIETLGEKFDVSGSGGLNTRLLYESTAFQSKQEAELNQLVQAMKTNAPNSEAYEKAKNRKDALLAEREAYLQNIYTKYPNAFFTRFKLAGQNPPVRDFKKPNGDLDTVRQLVDYREHFWDGVDFTDTRLLNTPVIFNKLQRYVKELTPQQPDSIIKSVDPLIRRSMPYPEYFKFFANWIALQYENTKTTVMDGEAVYVHIIQNFFKDELAFWDKPENLAKLRKHAWEMEASLLNKKGPDVIAEDVLTGQTKSIYTIPDPYIVVFMYSPDCEHCQKDAPVMQDLYRKWKPKGVEFFGIGVNTEVSALQQFVRKFGFTFSTVFDPTNRAIYAKYYVDITPEIYVLDKNRTIIAKNLKPEQLDAILEKQRF